MSYAISSIGLGRMNCCLFGLVPFSLALLLDAEQIAILLGRNVNVAVGGVDYTTEAVTSNFLVQDLREDKTEVGPNVGVHRRGANKEAGFTLLVFFIKPFSVPFGQDISPSYNGTMPGLRLQGKSE